MNFSETDLLKYCDGELSKERADRLRNATRHDPELAAALDAMEASRLPYKAAYAQQPVPPLPDELRSQVHNWATLASTLPTSEKSSRLAPWQRVATAACLIACVGLGYAIATQVDRLAKPTVDVTAAHMSPENIQAAWVERVADYQSLYVENTVKNIKNGQIDAHALFDDIAQRSTIRAGIPDFSAAGYHFVRAQELGYMNEPLIQLVYMKSGTTPLALCYMPADDAADAPLALATHHGLGTASWVMAGQRFVLVAD